MGNIESKDYLSKQIITYIGNKRELLSEIEKMVVFVRDKLNKDKMVCCDLFSGSGIVARLLKQYSSKVIANDLESYSVVLNKCYLSNKNELDINMYNKYLNEINQSILEAPISGIIRNQYSPKDDNNIVKGDRVFYTNENAKYIDSFRYYLDLKVPPEYRKFYLAPLLVECSIHVNTCGVFKGFYKNKQTGIGMYGGKAENSLSRIKGKIEIKPPILSEFECEYEVYQEDANCLVKRLKNLDLVYLDPPYNQHPYGSNYFMLNLIVKNELNPSISVVSGIPNDWNHSIYNKKQSALDGLKDLIVNLDSKYILISYNNEGFISYSEFVNLLKDFGQVKTKKIAYNTFRGSRNLNNRSIHTQEYLFLLEKRR